MTEFAGKHYSVKASNLNGGANIEGDYHNQKPILTVNGLNTLASKV
jgi:hypothetical protein